MKSKEQNNVVRKKKIIILSVVPAIILMVIIGIFLGNLIYKNIGKAEQQAGNVNILSLDETTVR